MSPHRLIIAQGAREGTVDWGGLATRPGSRRHASRCQRLGTVWYEARSPCEELGVLYACSAVACRSLG